MYCSKCGTENTDGSAFCRNCGARLTAPQTQTGVNSEQADTESAPLFESRGSTRGFTAASMVELVVGAVVLILGIVWQVNLNYYSDDLDKFMAIFCIVLGALMSALGVYRLYIAPQLWIRLYPDHIDGYGCNAMAGFAAKFEGPYARVEYVSTRRQSPGVLQLQLNGGKFLVPCQDTQRALEVLRSKKCDVRV